MAQVVRFSALGVGEDFFYVKSGRRTRFRKIAPLKLGEDLPEFHALQLGGGEGLFSLNEFEGDIEVYPIR